MKCSLAVAAAVLFLSAISGGAVEKPIDFWGEALDLVAASQTEKPAWDAKLAKDFSLDYTDKLVGDFSILYTASTETKAIGVLPNPFIGSWQVKPDYILHISLKSDKSTNQPITLMFSDAKNAMAVSDKLNSITSSWQEFTVPLAKFKTQKFDFGHVTVLKIALDVPNGGKVWIDDVYFKTSAGEVVGIIEKPVSQRIREAEQTRKQRSIEALKYTIKKPVEGALNSYFAKLYMNADVEQTNKELYNIFTTTDANVISRYGTSDTWSLWLNSMLIRMYYTFGSKSTIMPGRLNPQTQDALLELLWDRTKLKNEIQIARQSTWWLTGSENHDMNFKVSNLLSSQIFMNEPKFRDRVYPDIGKGAGSGYWFDKIPGGKYHGPEGRASWKEPNTSYTAKDHYLAWVSFLKQYFNERAAKGFFLENCSPTYMKYTMTYVLDAYDFVEDKELKDEVKKFMDLFNTEWMIGTVSGVKGGPKTREHGYTTGAVDSMYAIMKFALGADEPGIAGTVLISQLMTNYRIPEIAWQFALDREGLGEFEYISRGIGEEQNIWPRPAGLERTLLCDTESRFVKYSWITPDYIMGTQMDHPAAVHSHLSVASRWQGVVFSPSPKAVVMPRAIEVTGDKKWKIFKDGGVCRSVQYKNVLIAQQSRNFTAVSPDWYPQPDLSGLTWGVYFGKALDKIVEKDGWIFVQEGNAYLAVRVVKGRINPDDLGKTSWVDRMATESLYAELDKDSYEWNDEHTIIRLKYKFSPVLFETARWPAYADLDVFMKDVLHNELKLQKTVVPGYNILLYKGCGTDAKQIYFNAANNEIPQIDGKYIGYAPEMLFDCPYVKSAYKSKVITFTKGDEKLVLDFNK